MEERRNSRRLQLDVQLDDLQSEIEAGGRSLDRIQTEAGRIDQLTSAHLRQAGLTGRLRQQIGELKGSLRQQRTMLRELRAEMQRLGAQLKHKPAR